MTAKESTEQATERVGGCRRRETDCAAQQGAFDVGDFGAEVRGGAAVEEPDEFGMEGRGLGAGGLKFLSIGTEQPGDRCGDLVGSRFGDAGRRDCGGFGRRTDR